VSATRRPNLQAQYDAFLIALATNDIPMFLLHSWGSYHKLDGDEVVVHTVPLRAPTEVTSLSVDATIGTQRRRLRCSRCDVSIWALLQVLLGLALLLIGLCGNMMC
jgi:2C-methyl-D-erythritol 2,4-cyclodiphosphate synthase